jgi:transmembrane protein
MRNQFLALIDHPIMLLIFRVALVSAFIVSGVTKAADFAGATGEVRALSGVEPAGLWAVIVIAVQLGGSALVIAGGRAMWIGAVLLAGFTLLATIAAHAFWDRSGIAQIRDLTTFFEHMGLIAGLFLAVVLSERRREGVRS